LHKKCTQRPRYWPGRLGALYYLRCKSFLFCQDSLEPNILFSLNVGTTKLWS
jgi:hypothetical protein